MNICLYCEKEFKPRPINTYLYPKCCSKKCEKNLAKEYKEWCKDNPEYANWVHYYKYIKDQNRGVGQ